MKPGGLCFAETVSRVMLLRNVRDINIFRLKLEDEMFNEPQLDTWIRTTIARNVRSLDIHLGNEDWLPRCLFTCKTLVDLRLHYCGFVPDVVCLPNLKKLHLDAFQYGSDEKFQNLISGCPVLEELNIHTIIFNDLKSCIISSPTIKRLTLNLQLSDWHSYDEDSEDDFEDYKLMINTPALRYLDVEDRMYPHISTGTFNSLVEANICLNDNEVKDEDLYSTSVLVLVEKVCQVKCLTLSIRDRQFLDSSFAASTSKFINLTKLELDADWLFLFKFLESADNLQVLVIREVHNNLKCWMEPKQVPTCLSSHLRQVTIDTFGYSEDEFEMVSYILKNGEVLKMMKIFGNYCVLDLEKKDSALQKKKFNSLQRISTFERRSQTYLNKHMVTVALNYGGLLFENSNGPTIYEAGHVYKFDYFEFDRISIIGFKKFCEKMGLPDFISCYIKVDNKFKELKDDVELHEFCLKNLDKTREINVYLNYEDGYGKEEDRGPDVEKEGDREREEDEDDGVYRLVDDFQESDYDMNESEDEAHKEAEADKGLHNEAADDVSNFENLWEKHVDTEAEIEHENTDAQLLKS
ncbi:hypothetical protein BUALT_Bualt16G0004200 [Buddleja alternifolia]|uniref:FBD domain-containing protein n=1 Tax=Buddleja alternifolia TaxID=168488 RepID=A0AAV6WIN9_9LAMI|nr:hypothetical protein BUALT_Bualt16G0004200 [Buddleja alternifolia]